MRKIFFLLSFIAFFLIPKEALANYDPLSVPNNRFGIHISQEADLTEAAQTVNSSGGDWGYVTMVIRSDERDSRRWQTVFNQMRRLHLIPLIRMAAVQKDHGWEKLNEGEIDGWVDFLGSLNWPTQNMYVIVGNEPNHAKEWGGEVSPEEYTSYLNSFIDKARGKSSDFFILPAALDFSAKSDGQSLNATTFIERLLKVDPGIFEKLDGWNSHSYPNPNFTGSEKDVGRGSVASYAWELSYLKSQGVSKNFPVFITETGWAHDVPDTQLGYIKADLLGSKFSYSFQHTWNDERIVAVTPFIFAYEDSPFDIFSWKKKDGSFYSFVEEFKAIAKPKGDPLQKASGEIVSSFTPPYVQKGSTFTGALFVKNTGQSIWNEDDLLLLRDLDNNIEITKFVSFPKMEPNERKIVLFEAKGPNTKGHISGSLTLYEKGKMITNSSPYVINSYDSIKILGQINSLRNGIASSLWLLRINLLGR